MRVRGLRRSLPKMLKIGRIVGRLNAIESAYPPMDDGIRARLRGYFEADNDALGKWLDRDLSGWG